MDKDTKLLNLALDAGEIMLMSGAGYHAADIICQRTAENRSACAFYHADCQLAQRRKRTTVNGKGRIGPICEF